MATCTLRIGDRVALASVGGAPEVEYQLFDPGEIELVASGPGMVQEVGYRTSAEEAIGRLMEVGVTWPLVLEVAAAMQPTVAMAYARGPALRRIAPSLGPAELFDGFRYDPARKSYEGRWLDLVALTLDAGIPRLSQVLQSMHLLALLQEVNGRDPVLLVTRDHMAQARPGGRSYRRYAPPPPEDLPDRLRAFAVELRSLRPEEREMRTNGPSTAEILDALRDRIVLVPHAESQDRLHAIERAVGIRQRPMRGPLADADLWALEDQLSSGRHEGVVEILDSLEKTKGKQPATAYLRARAALIAGREPPKMIAEKISSLALTMPAFVELELLAAEAWNAAGDPRRALPFIRDLISNASVNDELRVRESQLSVRRPSQEVEAVTVVPTPERETMPYGERKPTPAGVSARREARSDRPGVTVPTPNAGTLAALANDPRRRPTPAMPGADPLRARRSVPPPLPASHPAPASTRKETPPMMFGVTEPEKPSARPLAVPTTRSPGLLQKRPISGTWVGPPPQKANTPGSTDTSFGAVPPPASGSDRPTGPTTVRPPAAASSTSNRTTSRPTADVPRLANLSATELMRGASQPPFRSDSPDAHTHVPKASAVPRVEEEPEAAVALTLPEDIRGVPEPIETLPRTVLDARVQFTFLSRELGREYDEQLGIVLRADVAGIESMQRVLLERYKDRSITTPEAAADVRRHGAFLSEILARTFGAFWVDIGPNDVGYWAMLVPPGTRVWPFGRVLRLIAMQHNERDLVSYFLELQSRARA